MSPNAQRLLEEARQLTPDEQEWLAECLLIKDERAAADVESAWGDEIKRRLEGVTQRVLTQTLRRLERNGMIERRVLPTSPIGVEYSLTPLGESLREPFGQLYDWTVAHADEIRMQQLDYDRRQS